MAKHISQSVEWLEQREAQARAKATVEGKHEGVPEDSRKNGTNTTNYPGKQENSCGISLRSLLNGRYCHR